MSTMAAINAHLNNIFYDAAKRKEKEMKGNVYSYKYYIGLFMDVLYRQGKCEVLAVNYSRTSDCNVYTLRDLQTQDIFLAEEFSIRLENDND